MLVEAFQIQTLGQQCKHRVMPLHHMEIPLLALRVILALLLLGAYQLLVEALQLMYQERQDSSQGGVATPLPLVRPMEWLRGPAKYYRLVNLMKQNLP